MKEQKGKDVSSLMVTTKVSKWGNSSAVRIPNQFTRLLNLKEGDVVQIKLTSEKDLLLRPIIEPQEQESSEELREHLKNLLSQIEPDSPRHEEIDFGIEGNERI